MVIGYRLWRYILGRPLADGTETFQNTLHLTPTGVGR